MTPHLLSVDDLNLDALDELFSVAQRLEPVARRQKVTRILEGAVLGNLFFEASTRTRISFNTAFCRLGGTVCDTTGFTFSSKVSHSQIPAELSLVMSMLLLCVTLIAVLLPNLPA